MNEAEIKNESSFVDDLGADSLDTVELVMALEDEFETEIPDEEAEKITTVQQAIDYASTHAQGLRLMRSDRRVAEHERDFGRRLIACPVAASSSPAWADQPGGQHRGRRPGTTWSPAVAASTRSPVRRLAPSPARFAGEVKGFDVDGVHPGARKRATWIPSSITAWRRASRRCRTPAAHCEITARRDAERIGVHDRLGHRRPADDRAHPRRVLLTRGPRRISPFFVPASIINMISGHLSIMYGFKGPNLAIVTACTTGLHCIGEAGRLIEYGDADVMVAGGAEVDGVAAGHRRLRRGARAVDAQRRSGDRVAGPGTSDRDGFVLGEGAGVLVLEEYEHAKARGAKIYCELAGFGMSARRVPHDAPPETSTAPRAA